MFKGQYSNNIDVKGRMILPAKFRTKLGEQLVVSRGLDGCLSVYPMEKWHEIETKLTSLPTTKKKARDYARLILAFAADLDCDSKGRINIPENLIQIATLDKKCIVIGVGDHLEIWDEAKWNDYNASVEESFEDIAEDLVDFEI